MTDTMNSNKEEFEEKLVPSPVDITKPLWDQNTYRGRLNYFFRVTNPLLLLKSKQEYVQARSLVLQARSGLVPQGTTRKEVVDAKVLYDSAYHPDTGEEMNMIGRMSFQVPGGVCIIGILMTFYQKFIYVVLGQWLNQSFNALVNYTNRNAKSETTSKQILTAYVGATGGAVAVAAGMNALVKMAVGLIKKKGQKAPAIVRRWVPFVAVVTANCINIPVMRQRELLDGIIVTDEEGNNLTKSKVAAKKGISLVLLSRISLVTPPMLLVPVAMQQLERKFPFLHKKGPALAAQMLLTAACMSLSVPMTCSLFPQRMSMNSSHLEKSAQEEILSQRASLPHKVYFNKGL